LGYDLEKMTEQDIAVVGKMTNNGKRVLTGLPSLQKKKARVNGGASEQEKRKKIKFNKAQLITLAHWVSLQHHGEEECADGALGGGFGLLSASAWYFKVSVAVLEFDGYQGTEKVACKEKNDAGVLVWPAHAIKAMKNRIHSFVTINNGKRWLEWFKKEKPGNIVGRDMIVAHVTKTSGRNNAEKPPWSR